MDLDAGARAGRRQHAATQKANPTDVTCVVRANQTEQTVRVQELEATPDA